MRAVVALIGAWGAACAAAFQFLTRLPVPVRLEYDDALFRRSVVFFIRSSAGCWGGSLLYSAVC